MAGIATANQSKDFPRQEREQNDPTAAKGKRSFMPGDVDIKHNSKASQGFPVYVSKVGRSNRKIFDCDTNEVVASLTERIRKEMAMERGVDILLYERAGMPGTISRPLPHDKIISYCLKDDLVFDIEKREAHIGHLEKYCCQQNIALIGASKHGKSSTINTISKAVRHDANTTPAQTYQPEKGGTSSYTEHKIHINQSWFILCDVPGKSITKTKSGNPQKMFDNIFQGKQKPDRVPGTSTRRIRRHHRKIHTLVIVQDGTADIESMHMTALTTAKRKGRGIPVFILITKLDRMDKAGLASMKEKLSDSLGIDQSVMFGIANCEEESQPFEDPQKEEYILSMLERLLASSKMHKDTLGKAGRCEYQ